MNVLIDNDKLIHLSWRLKAESLGIPLKSFFSVEDFLQSYGQFTLESNIYIDSDLGENIKGEVEAEQIANLGFQNIWLASGYDDIDIQSYPWIKGIISKKPPF